MLKYQKLAYCVIKIWNAMKNNKQLNSHNFGIILHLYNYSFKNKIKNKLLNANPIILVV